MKEKKEENMNRGSVGQLLILEQHFLEPRFHDPLGHNKK